MTKNQFRQEAAKAGVNPNLYGVVIRSSLHCRDGRQIINGKVIGITWFEEWTAAKEYRPGLGEWDSTALTKIPYIVLKKGRDTYFVHRRYINAYLEKMLTELLISMAKTGKRQADS